jgi:hypothetical protein
VGVDKYVYVRIHSKSGQNQCTKICVILSFFCISGSNGYVKSSYPPNPTTYTTSLESS